LNNKKFWNLIKKNLKSIYMFFSKSSVPQYPFKINMAGNSCIFKPKILDISGILFWYALLQYSISRLKNLDQLVVIFIFSLFCNLYLSYYFSKKKWIICDYILPSNITHIFHLRFQWNLHHYFYQVYPTNWPKINLK